MIFRFPSAPLLLGTAGLFLSCLQPLDSSSLRAKAEHPVKGADCASCHPYDLQDNNHVFHITYADLNVKQVNGKVTCLDCHLTAILSRPLTLLDSIYQDRDGIIRSSIDNPLSPEIREGTLLRVDTLRHNRPIPSPRVIPGEHEIQEWLTGLAHMDGTVDVVFDSSVTDRVRFEGRSAEFNPKSETCSAISCHEDPGAYRFKAGSKGLSGLTGDSLPSP